MTGTVQGCFCASTRRAARRLTEHYEAELGKVGLSASQFELLSLLAAAPRNGRSIAALLGLDATTVSRNLKPLIADGHVTQAVMEGDARQLQYSLTAAGRTVQRRAMTHWRRAQAGPTRSLGADAMAALQILQRLSGPGKPSPGKPRTQLQPPLLRGQ